MLTSDALPVLSTDALAVPVGGAVNATPSADFLARFPERVQQICAGATLQVEGRQHLLGRGGLG